jgi:hypothetical protein
MLKQEELALMRATSSVQGNPLLLRELRKALDAKKTSKAAACCTAKTSRVTPSKRHATATTTGARIVTPPLPIAWKRKAEFSCSDGLTTPAARRPAPDAQGTSVAPTPSTRRQLDVTAGKPAYAAVLAGDSNPHQSSGQPKPIATGSDFSEPAASSEAATRRMSVDMSGPLGSMPAGATEAGALLAGERPYKTPSLLQVSPTRAGFSRGYGPNAPAVCPPR